MAGPATSGKRLTFNNMQGTPVPLPITIGLGPGEEVELQLEMRMMAGMEGPHQFRLPVLIEGEQQPLELHVHGTFR